MRSPPGGTDTGVNVFVTPVAKEVLSNLTRNKGERDQIAAEAWHPMQKCNTLKHLVVTLS